MCWSCWSGGYPFYIPHVRIYSILYLGLLAATIVRHTVTDLMLKQPPYGIANTFLFPYMKLLHVFVFICKYVNTFFYLQHMHKIHVTYKPKELCL